MNGAGPPPATWQALTPWLNDLLRNDQAVHVRCNLAMLAADLATNDADARRALAEMLAQASDVVIRTGAAGDLLVLRQVLHERARLPGAAQTALDDEARQIMEHSSQHWSPERAVDAVLRINDMIGVLPISVAANAALNAARRMAGNRDGRDRDAARTRLVQLLKLDRSLPKGLRREFRECLRAGLERISSKAERKRALFELLTAAPALLEPSAEGGPEVVGGAVRDAAARAGRPRWQWIVARSALAAGVACAVLTLLVAAISMLRDNGIDATAGAYSNLPQDGFLLLVIAFCTTLAVACTYTPSLQRATSPLRALRHATLPALAGAAMAVLLANLFLSSTLEMLVMAHDAAGWAAVPFRASMLLGVTVGLALLATAALAPSITRLTWSRLPNVSVLPQIAFAPIVAVWTAACWVGAVFEDASLLPAFWPIVSVATMAANAVLVGIETETAPSLDVTPSKGPRWLPAPGWTALPIMLAASIAAVFAAYTVWRAPREVSLLDLAPGQARTVRVEKRRPLTILGRDDKPVSVSASAGLGASVLLRKDKGWTDPVPTFVLAGRAVVCVVASEGRKQELSLEDWLSILIHPGLTLLTLRINEPAPAEGANR